MTELLLRGGRPWRSTGPVDLLIADGVIKRIGPGPVPISAKTIDVSGKLILPGLIDAHCHLDKTLYGRAWISHSAGDLLSDRISNERLRRSELGVPSVDSITLLLEAMVTAGTTHARTHTDVASELGLAGIEAVKAAVDRLSGRITVQQVAFPQYGILAEDGTVQLLEEALGAGAAVIGGIDPASIDRDPVRHLDTVFDLAGRYDVAIDLHLHDGGSLGAWELELIAEKTVATGLQGRVTVSHAYALGELEEAAQERIAHQLAVAGVSLVSSATYNFPIPPIKRLRSAGVTVGCGHDGIRDMWGPYGSGDMLERVMHLAYRSAFRRDEEIELALETATYGAARVIGLERYGLSEGSPADVVVLAADCASEAVVTHPVREMVLRGGRVVARAGQIV